MFRSFLILLTGLLAGTVFSQADTLIHRSHFFQSKDISEITLSKEGDRVYYRRRSAGEQALFYVEAEDPKTEKELSFSKPVLDWSTTHKDQLLLVLGTEAEKKLMLANKAGEIEKDLTPFGLRDLRIDAMSRLEPDKVALWVDGRLSRDDGIYVIDLEDEELDRISPQLGLSRRYYDGDLRLRAGRRSNGRGGHTIMVRVEGEWRELIAYPFDEGMFLGGIQDVISVSEDGEKLFLIDNLGKDKTTLIEVDLDTLSNRRELVADPLVDILPFGAMVAPNGWPQMVLGSWAQARRHYLHGQARDDFEWLNRQLGGTASYAQRSADGRTWLIRQLRGGPVQYYLFNRSRRELIPLFSDYPALEGADLAERHTRTVITRDSIKLPVHVYLPPRYDEDYDGVPDTTLPTLLYVHGGPWAGVTHWNSWFHNRNFQLLANRGYVVINTEFRGTTGLGKEMTRKGDRQWGEGMLNDLIDISEWAVHEGIADPARIGLWGWSYGGYAAAAALTFAPGRFACGLSMYGPYDLDAFSRIPYTDDERWREVVGNPYTDEGAELLRRQSPFHHIDRLREPLLITTGGDDARVPKTQVDAYADSLAQAGKELIYFYYPEEVHDYRKPESWISFWAIAEKFLHDHLGGKYQPAGKDLSQGNYVVVYGKEYVEGLD